MNICWYCPTSIGTDFLNIEDNPSFRLRFLTNHILLKKDGYNSYIIDNENDIGESDIVILMTFGETEYNIAKRQKERNKFVIHDYCEDIRGIEILEKTKDLCDYIICCSTVIAEKENDYKPSKKKYIVIKDPIEEFNYIKNHREKDILNVVWCGMGGNASLPKENLKPIIESVNMNYIEISNNEDSTIEWNYHTWMYNMLEGDIAICPQRHWHFPAKSNVKVTQAMALGLPVLASPLKSYQEIIRQGENGFICKLLEDWKIYLEQLKSLELREKISSNARKSLNPYKKENIYKQWLDVFKNCIQS